MGRNERQNRCKAARDLREGIIISECDATLSFKDGKFRESMMVYDTYTGHRFSNQTVTWKTALSRIRAGWS